MSGMLNCALGHRPPLTNVLGGIGHVSVMHESLSGIGG